MQQNCSRAQGAIEYLLIIGAAILIVAIVILASTGILFGGQTTAEVSQKAQEKSQTALEDIKYNAQGYAVLRTTLDPNTPTQIPFALQGLTINGNAATTSDPDYTITNTSTGIIITNNGTTPIDLVIVGTQYVPTTGSKLLQTDGSVGQPIVRADGTPITTQAQLEDAYAAGEITIYKGGQPISVAQKTGTETYTLNIAGCYGGSVSVGYGGDMLAYSNAISQPTFYSGFGKILSVNNNPTYSSLIGKIHKLVPNPAYIRACCRVCGNTQCVILDPASFSMSSSQCPTSGNWNYGSTTAGWQVGIYTYNLKLGTASASGEIGIDTNTGTITGISFTHDDYSRCTDANRCYEYAGACDYMDNCIIKPKGQCATIPCNQEFCYPLSVYYDPNTDTNYSWCRARNIPTLDVTANYYT